MKKFIIALVCIFTLVQRGNAQVYDAGTKYVGFDANPLMSQVLPLNRIALSDQAFAITTRRFWGRNGLRASYGVGLGDGLEVNFFQIFIGYEHRRSINNHWYFFAGCEFLGRASSESTPSGSIELGQAQGVGVGGHWGVEYAFNNVVSLSTEASLRAMVGDADGVSLILVPPVNICAHFNITKK